MGPFSCYQPNTYTRSVNSGPFSSFYTVLPTREIQTDRRRWRRAGCKPLILRASRGPGRKNKASRGRRRGGRVRASPAHAAAAQQKADAGEKGRKERAAFTRAENDRRPKRGQQCRGRAARNQHKPAAARPPDRMLYNVVLCSAGRACRCPKGAAAGHGGGT